MNIENISIEALPHVLEHDLAQLATLENHFVALENYMARAQDGNLYGRDLDDCKNICAYYNPSISTESLTVSNESIIGFILAAIAAMIITFAAFIARGFQIGKKMEDNGVSQEDYDAAVERLGKGVGLFDSDALNEAIKIANARREVTTVDISSKSLKEITSILHTVDNNLPRILEHLSAAFVLTRDLLKLNFKKAFTIKDMMMWANNLDKRTFAESIMDLIKLSGSELGKDSILSLEAINLDPVATSAAIQDAVDIISQVNNKHKELLRDKSTYQVRVKAFDDANGKLNEIDRKLIVQRGDKNVHILSIVKNLQKTDWTRLDKKVENELRAFAKLNDKSSVQQYIKPYTDVLENLAGLSDVDEKRVGEDVKRIVRHIPRYAGRVVGEYARFQLMIHRYKRFIVKSGDIITHIQEAAE